MQYIVYVINVEVGETDETTQPATGIPQIVTPSAPVLTPEVSPVVPVTETPGNLNF